MNNKAEQFTFRKLNMDDLDRIMAMQDEIIEALEDKTLLRKNTREMFAGCLEEPNFSVGVFDESRMIALGIMVDARGTEEDLGAGLEKFTVDKNINMKSTMVLPAYRGNGLQRKLINLMENIAAERGYTDACASISPDNQYSLNNAKLLGYEVDHTAVKYGGLTRAIVVKKLLK